MIQGDALKFLEKHGLNYDFIFADPPYNLTGIDKIPDLVFGNEKVKESTLLVIEHSENYNFSDNKYFTNTRKYGKVNFSFFSNEL